MKKTVKLLFILWVGLFSAQRISMEFPRFAGKTYDFILFRGSEPKTVYQGTIPPDGKFILNVPAEYAPYTGMCRWLITGTEQGGGLDMVIPGGDFSVRCLSEKPDNDNIVYTGNGETKKMNRYSQRQQEIFMRHDAMLQATRAFPRSDKNYGVFQQEYKDQFRAYDSLQAELSKDKSYAAEFLKIVNITMGIGKKLEETEEKRAESIADYIADELNWDVLYTSGHWPGVISSWVDIHLQVLKDDKRLIRDFGKIGSKINKGSQYADFADRVAFLLTQQGADRLIDAIAPEVLSSGKIEKYEGHLSVYKRSGVGAVAPDLVWETGDEGKKQTRILKIRDLLGSDHKNILLVFYNSGCGPCEKTLEELSVNYEKLSRDGVRVIGLSSDKDPLAFRKTSATFPGKEAYCDYQGLEGINFKNYGVLGTPTLVLIGQTGKIRFLGSGLDEVRAVLQ
ncbi:peroxiredoxin family protein [Chryseobacterium gossypii]|uniref:peroxiredoxin family protein n=1 Tax=Chryseobacterium gossypii TaxID=3231602 RepID=UPI0035251E0A